VTWNASSIGIADTDAAVRPVLLYQADGNMEAAVRVLRVFRRYKEAWRAVRIIHLPMAASEAARVGSDFHRLSDFNEAAVISMHSTSCWGRPATVNPAKSGLTPRATYPGRALYRIFDSLMLAVGKPTQIGSGNLDYTNGLPN